MFVCMAWSTFKIFDFRHPHIPLFLSYHAVILTFDETSTLRRFDSAKKFDNF